MCDPPPVEHTTGLFSQLHCGLVLATIVLMVGFIQVIVCVCMREQKYGLDIWLSVV